MRGSKTPWLVRADGDCETAAEHIPDLSKDVAKLVGQRLRLALGPKRELKLACD